MTIDSQLSLLKQTQVGGPKKPLQVSRDIIKKLAQGDKDSVLSAIQDAIKLEHSTIPPYLYALYSLDETKNAGIADIIQSVVVEEMLHMTLACNILNALGGTPDIDTPSFIPTYPGTLPGIEPPNPNWKVDLKPCSKDVVQSVFMQIEMPEKPHDFPVKPQAVLGAEEAEELPRTIGAFYQLLEAQIKNLGEGAFVSPPRNQVGPDIMFESVVVSDFASAQQAIGIIIDQGEGTDPDPFDEEGAPAHYYRYAEIIKGQKLGKIPGNPPTYAYNGDPVTLDTSGVWKVAPDRKGDNQAVLTFNYTYTSLLKTLHAFFNGQNTSQQFNTALGLMMSLKQQAMEMMSTLGVGPSFEYQPTNPGINSGG